MFKYFLNQIIVETRLYLYINDHHRCISNQQVFDDSNLIKYDNFEI